tara:strand:+ start:1914 stop:2150 length:237 start_codon:yes stop_codon:yes gene_type:complete
MRPRFVERGKEKLIHGANSKKEASMRPRFVERGKEEGEEGKERKHTASMRPRFVERGKLGAFSALAGSGGGFNEAALR